MWNVTMHTCEIPHMWNVTITTFRHTPCMWNVTIHTCGMSLYTHVECHYTHIGMDQ